MNAYIVWIILSLVIAVAFLLWQLHNADDYIDDLEDRIDELETWRKHWMWEPSDRRQF